MVLYDSNRIGNWGKLSLFKLCPAASSCMAAFDAFDALNALDPLDAFEKGCIKCKVSSGEEWAHLKKACGTSCGMLMLMLWDVISPGHRGFPTPDPCTTLKLNVSL